MSRVQRGPHIPTASALSSAVTPLCRSSRASCLHCNPSIRSWPCLCCSPGPGERGREVCGGGGGVRDVRA
eukprot:2939499-Prymnesium_polylepis.1